MAIKHKIKFKGDRDRGTSPAVLRSSGPKQRPERVATTLGVEGESIRRDVPDNDNVFNDKTISDDYKVISPLKSTYNDTLKLII